MAIPNTPRVVLLHSRARNGAESIRPGLWDKKIAHWVPGLGPTGDSLIDLSGNGLHAPFGSGPPLLSDFQITDKGYALDCNDVSGPFHLTMGDMSRLNLASENYSIAGFIRPDNSARARILLTKAGFNADGWRLTITNTDVLKIFHFTAGANTSAETTAITGLPRWLYFTVVRNGSVVTFWIDGVDVTSDGSIDPMVIPTGRNLVIGVNASNQDYDGLIGDLRVYNRALTYKEHLWLYANPYVDLIKKSKVARREF